MSLPRWSNPADVAVVAGPLVMVAGVLLSTVFLPSGRDGVWARYAALAAGNALFALGWVLLIMGPRAWG